jgi:hydrogenase expression/formation protein HypC
LCLAIPAKVIKLEGEKAEVEIGGIKKEASLALVADQGVVVGDYILIHTGYAITKLDEKEAESFLKTWREVMATEQAESL